jgi:uncharacterized repeat protein (TIGR03803 family)
MCTPGTYRPRIFGLCLPVATIAIGFAFLLTVSAQVAEAQTYSVLYNFTGGNDGGNPYAGVTMDNAGNLYGTTLKGGSGYGSVFTLQPVGNGWTFSTIYSFRGGDDGAGPVARVIIGPSGFLYGTTSAGGGGSCRGSYSGCGTVFSLSPSVGTFLSRHPTWNESVLYRFHGLDGAYPQGDLTFAPNGNIYGTTVNGGLTGVGTVYALSPNGGGLWLQNVILALNSVLQGSYPWGGVVFDRSGNLYGVLAHDGLTGYGTVYKLTPEGFLWLESNVHGFTWGNDGAIPQGGLTTDASGNVFGTTIYGGSGSGGVAFEDSDSGGSWSHHILHAFSGGIGLGSYDKLAMDSSGNLYGTTFAEGSSNCGTVFELVRSGNNYTYQTLHTFTGGSGGAYPFSTLAIDSDRNLYGTTSSGGSHNQGIVFKIAPSRR